MLNTKFLAPISRPQILDPRDSDLDYRYIYFYVTQRSVVLSIN